ncbi:MAG: hypothetical protein AB8B74_11300 [Crocinitomicaceae bacterium]
MKLGPDVPLIASLLFIFSVIFCVFSFYWIAKGSHLLSAKLNAIKISIGITFWLFIQMLLTQTGIYSSGMTTVPPKIILFGVLPAFIAIIIIFNTRKGKVFIDSLPLKRVTTIHIVRIFVEVGLYYLFIGKAIPEIMTFSGQNFDILAGITAPFIIYFGLYKKTLNKHLILIWNIVSLGLLSYIILLAILSAPSPFQQVGFDQPNIAIFYNPYSWLPTLIVPMVIFMHLVAIRQLIFKNEE